MESHRRECAGQSGHGTKRMANGANPIYAMNAGQMVLAGGCPPGHRPFTCLEIDIPDDKVLLSDFETWHVPLNHGLMSDTEEEDAAQEAYYNSLTDEQKKAYRDWNWEQVFDVTPFENDWVRRGSWVQATFWELRKEQIRKVRFFTTGKSKPKRGS